MTAVNVCHLISHTDAPYHVHGAGCADLQRNANRGRYQQIDVTPAAVEEFASLQELTESYYDGHLSDSPDATWADYADEFKVFPCVKWSAS